MIEQPVMQGAVSRNVKCSLPIVHGRFFESKGAHKLHNIHCHRRQTSLETPTGKIRILHVAMLKGMLRSGTPALVDHIEGREACAAEIFRVSAKVSRCLIFINVCVCLISHMPQSA